MSTSDENELIDVCISYPDPPTNSRKKLFFANAKELIQTLESWKAERKDNIILTWGTTPEGNRKRIEMELYDKGVKYWVPSTACVPQASDSVPSSLSQRGNGLGISVGAHWYVSSFIFAMCCGIPTLIFVGLFSLVLNSFGVTLEGLGAAVGLVFLGAGLLGILVGYSVAGLLSSRIPANCPRCRRNQLYPNTRDSGFFECRSCGHRVMVVVKP